MAGADSNPYISTVLHSYKNKAMSSLQGPGSAVHIMPDTKKFCIDIPERKVFFTHKKKIHFEEHTKKLNEFQSQNECAKKSESSWAIPIHISEPNPGRLGLVKGEKLLENGHTILIPQGTQLSIKKEEKHLQPASEKTRPNETQVTFRPPIKKEILADNSSKDCSANFKWIEPQVFLAPAPFPPQPLPILTTSDPGVLPTHNRSETNLDGHQIACFLIGGEPRLCLIQIFNSLLTDFSVAEINAVCDNLQIYCSRCTTRQLEYLKETGILPPSSANSCGLITKTDAQRLIHALLYAQVFHPLPKGLHRSSPQIQVFHECFGKCKGTVFPELYTSLKEPCILCSECNNLFSTNQFVCHVHSSLENRTCHWGFDAEVYWTYYLYLSRNQVMPVSKAEEELNAFKNKFDSNLATNHKRKQSYANDELSKKIRAEDASVPYPSPPYSSHSDAMLSKYLAWGSAYSTKAPAWTVVPLMTKDGRALPLPHNVFAKESIPSPLPPYLSQGPPVLADPARVVPSSESEKFERNFQPNVALAPLPPKIRDKVAREQQMYYNKCDIQGNLKEVSKYYADLNSMSCEPSVKCEKDQNNRCESNEKIESSPPSLSPGASSSRSSLSAEERLGLLQRSHPCNNSRQSNAHHVGDSAPFKFLKHKIPRSHSYRSSTDSCTPESESIPTGGESRTGSNSGPTFRDLVTSSTNSDTESASSVSSRGDIVDEVETLLRSWSDRSAANQVLNRVSSLVKSTSRRKLSRTSSRMSGRSRNSLRGEVNGRQILTKKDRILSDISRNPSEVATTKNGCQDYRSWENGERRIDGEISPCDEMNETMAEKVARLEKELKELKEKTLSDNSRHNFTDNTNSTFNDNTNSTFNITNHNNNIVKAVDDKNRPKTNSCQSDCNNRPYKNLKKAFIEKTGGFRKLNGNSDFGSVRVLNDAGAMNFKNYDGDVDAVEQSLKSPNSTYQNGVGSKGKKICQKNEIRQTIAKSIDKNLCKISEDCSKWEQSHTPNCQPINNNVNKSKLSISTSKSLDNFEFSTKKISITTTKSIDNFKSAIDSKLSSNEMARNNGKSLLEKSIDRLISNSKKKSARKDDPSILGNCKKSTSPTGS